MEQVKNFLVGLGMMLFVPFALMFFLITLPFVGMYEIGKEIRERK